MFLLTFNKRLYSTSCKTMSGNCAVGLNLCLFRLDNILGIVLQKPRSEFVQSNLDLGFSLKLHHK